MIELKKKDKESSLNLLRRFTKKVRQSGVLLEARRNMFHVRPKNKLKKKNSALRRERLRALRAELAKLGEVEPGEKIDLSKIKRKR
ncbi:MAG: 30S ribosomal protein S21 [Patescibacteria group bacterium]